MDNQKRIYNTPLTIEEIKVLKMGDWVYIQALTTETSSEFDLLDTEFYYRVVKRQDDTFFEVVGGELMARHYLHWNDYGTKWLAYKNKEEAEKAGYGDVKQAVKEFAERLKKRATWYDTETCDDDYYNLCVMLRDIDELLKEYSDVNQT